MSRYMKGALQPKLWLQFPGTCDVRVSRTKLFLTSRRPFLVTFATKSYLSSETHIAYKFYTLYPKKCFSERNFYLHVENVMRVLDPFFFIPSHGVGLLFTYKVSDVSGAKRVAL